jgi:hypothetical protein
MRADKLAALVAAVGAAVKAAMGVWELWEDGWRESVRLGSWEGLRRRRPDWLTVYGRDLGADADWTGGRRDAGTELYELGLYKTQH